MNRNLLNSNLPSRIRFLALVFISGYFLGGCAETKSFQCQKIFKIANNVTQETTSLTKSGQASDKKNWLSAADEIEQGASDMEKLDITDPTLKEYQSGFAEVYRDYATATREIVKVLDTRDRIAAKAAQEKVRRAGKQERELGEKINSYCRGE